MTSDAALPDALLEYKGNCHCGAFRFRFKAPKITAARECDCSICFKNNYLWQPPAEGSFIIEKGEEDKTLVSYKFGKKVLAHKFCPTCGTSVLGRYSTELGDSVMINLRAVNDIDFWSLTRSPAFKGLKEGDPYQTPTAVSSPTDVDSSAPEAVQEIQTYHGSCHCGAVAFTLRNPGKITSARECNCSICARDGVAWIYPPTRNIAFRGLPEYVGEYTFAANRTFHGFCKICGVSIYERFIGLNDEGLERSLRRALNVRTINHQLCNFDFVALEIEKWDGKAKAPMYTVPT
ncbi:GFA domain-containing protein [Mycena kentingensis (nom. inval.)]|nr:GFA domain-containing protein [Mycena kentingensis (nom. inval.)]